jgi:sugar lactone lactonase YvrE
MRTVAGKIELFADGATIDKELHLQGPTALYFADGLQFDVKGNLYVMATWRTRFKCSRPTDGSSIATKELETTRSISMPAWFSRVV